MVNITLSDEHVLALVDLLDCAIADTRSEIIRTDSYCLKDLLKNRKQLLIDLREVLIQANPAAIG